MNYVLIILGVVVGYKLAPRFVDFILGYFPVACERMKLLNQQVNAACIGILSSGCICMLIFCLAMTRGLEPWWIRVSLFWISIGLLVGSSILCLGFERWQTLEQKYETPVPEDFKCAGKPLEMALKHFSKM